VKSVVLKLAFCCFLGFLCSINGYSQFGEGLQQWAEEVASIYAEETEVEDVSMLTEHLIGLARNPININIAGREELEQIFFLTDIQVENILFKRYVNGSFLTIYELQAVEGLPVDVIQMLEPLLVFGPQEPEKRKFRLWGDSFVRAGFQMEKARGFEDDDSGSAIYQGDRFKLYNRTQVETNRNFYAGMIVEKDPGEPMFGKGVNGIDLMSGYVHYKKGNGWFREALAGRYFASAAQGMVLQSGMPMRKSSMTTSIRNRRASFRPSLSASEAMAMQGGYAVLGYKSIEVTPFYSLNYRDGRIDENGILTSLREDGFHRTETELDQRHNVLEQVAGGKVSWSGRWLNLEAGHVNYQLDRSLEPKVHPYNQFYFRGKENSNSWLGYMVSRKNLLFFGEAASNDLSHYAFYNGVVWGSAPGFSLSLSQRLVSKYYNSPLAGPMTESGSFQGEEGYYCGIRWELPFQIIFSSYFDYYRFHWLKFRIDAPASGFDWLGHLEKDFGKDATLRLKFRHREKPVNITGDTPEDGVFYQKYNQVKVQYRQKVNPGWQLTSQAIWHFVSNESENQNGELLAQDLRWSNENQTLTVTGRLAVFSNTGYEARLYSYEPHVLYMFSVPAYSGKGSRYLLMVNYKVAQNLHFWLRAARWQYVDREEIGSGNQMIASNHKTEFTFQVRVKF
jgi:hypothetical protein